MQARFAFSTEVSGDPTGPLPAPDAQGAVVLFGDKPPSVFGIGLTFGIGFGVFAGILWAVHFGQAAEGHAGPGFPLLAVMASVATVLIFWAAIRSRKAAPPYFRIETDGLTTIDTRGRGKTMNWPEMSEVKLVSNIVGDRPQGRRRVEFVFYKTQVSVISYTQRFDLPYAAGVAPRTLAAYILERQHQASPGALAVLNDETRPVETLPPPPVGPRGESLVASEPAGWRKALAATAWFFAFCVVIVVILLGIVISVMWRAP